MIITSGAKCVACSRTVEDIDEAVAFPAFVPKWHELSNYSDCVFHKKCFYGWSGHEELQDLYNRYLEAWEHRPKDASSSEIDAWVKDMHVNLFGDAANSEL